MAEDDGVIPVFYIRAVKNNFKSKQEGRPIYDDKEYVQMLIPGDKNEVPDFQVTDEHRERWPEAYRRFKDKQEPTTSGTPLDQWPVMTPARASSLKDQNIFTVEQMANLPDVRLKEIGPDARDLQKQAKHYLEYASGAQTVNDIQELREEIEALKAENAELKKNQKKKPGRKKTSESEAA